MPVGDVIPAIHANGIPLLPPDKRRCNNPRVVANVSNHPIPYPNPQKAIAVCPFVVL